MQQYLLTLLIFIPLVAALIALMIPSSFHKSFRLITIAASILQLAVLLQVILSYKSSSGLQFVEQIPWITLDLGSWGFLQAEYFVGLDGLNIVLVTLSVLIMLIAAVASQGISRNVKGYFVLFLILNTAIIGTFTALDFLLFYLFFEFMLLPMFFLIGIWNVPKNMRCIVHK